MNCPRCGQKMNKCSITETFFEVGRGWGGEIVYICFNDDCPYFVKGWEWMREKYMRTASYRLAYNPATGREFPIPVVSYDSLKETIVEEN